MAIRCTRRQDQLQVDSQFFSSFWTAKAPSQFRCFFGFIFSNFIHLNKCYLIWTSHPDNIPKLPFCYPALELIINSSCNLEINTVLWMLHFLTKKVAWVFKIVEHRVVTKASHLCNFIEVVCSNFLELLSKFAQSF